MSRDNKNKSVNNRLKKKSYKKLLKRRSKLDKKKMSRGRDQNKK